MTPVENPCLWQMLTPNMHSSLELFLSIELNLKNVYLGSLCSQIKSVAEPICTGLF